VVRRFRRSATGPIRKVPTTLNANVAEDRLAAVVAP
jgi:hypothetical protein